MQEQRTRRSSYEPLAAPLKQTDKHSSLAIAPNREGNAKLGAGRAGVPTNSPLA